MYEYLIFVGFVLGCLSTYVALKAGNREENYKQTIEGLKEENLRLRESIPEGSLDNYIKEAEAKLVVATAKHLEAHHKLKDKEDEVDAMEALMRPLENERRKWNLEKSTLERNLITAKRMKEHGMK